VVTIVRKRTVLAKVTKVVRGGKLKLSVKLTRAGKAAIKRGPVPVRVKLVVAKKTASVAARLG
jgi:hypothetical protein